MAELEGQRLPRSHVANTTKQAPRLQGRTLGCGAKGPLSNLTSGVQSVLINPGYLLCPGDFILPQGSGWQKLLVLNKLQIWSQCNATGVQPKRASAWESPVMLATFLTSNNCFLARNKRGNSLGLNMGIKERRWENVGGWDDAPKLWLKQNKGHLNKGRDLH